MIFIIFLTSLAGLVLLYALKQSQMYKATEHIPGPKPLPFIGNALDIGTKNENVLTNLENLVKKYGKVIRLCHGLKDGILVTDAKYVGQIFTATDSYYKGNLYDIVKPLIGKGLITSSGETWARHRRILNPAFSNKQLEKYALAINSAANKLVEQLKGRVHQEYVDISDLIFYCALNSICKAAMKIDITENRDYHSLVENLLDLFFKRFISPFKSFDFVYSFTNDYLETNKYAKEINDFVLDVMRKRQREFNLENAGRTSILDEMFRLSGEDSLTEQEMVDQVKTFVFAGSDTVGTTVNLAVYELAKHPDVQEKILEEVTGIKVETDMDDVRELKYTECVLKEVMRRYTPVPFATRILPNEMQLGDITVPAGIMAVLFMHGVHMSEEIYPNPERFDPDRFLPENCANRHMYSFVPFAAGARVCIGQKFSMLEAKLTLAKIVQNFELMAHPDHKLKLVAAGIVKSVNGLPIKLKLRKPAASI